MKKGIYFITNQTNLIEEWPEDIKLGTVDDLHSFLQQETEIGFDTETQGFDVFTKQLLSAQFGNRDIQFVLDCTTINIQQFKEYFEDNTKVWLMQNAKFDLKFLFRQGIFPAAVYDTMLAERILTTGLMGARKGLDFLVSKYTEGELDKTIRGKILTSGISDVATIKYAAFDVKYLHEIKYKQMIAIRQADLVNALNLDNLFVIVLAYIEFSGIKLDSEKWRNKMAKDKSNLIEYKNILDNWIIGQKLDKYIDNQLDLFNSGVNCNINWASSKQVTQLMKDFGIDTQVKDDKKGFKDSVDAKVLASQSSKSPIISGENTLIDIYLKYKGAEKVVTTYGDTFLKQINPVTQRIHSNFTQIMDTGRLSCGGKNRATGEEYLNLQNIPSDSDTRSCFIADKENTLVIADYSGQEQIVLANQSLDADLLDFYDKDLGDMHSFIASKIFPELQKYSLKEIKTQCKKERQIAKSAGFAINYGGNGLTIATNLSIPVSQGEEVYQAYLKAFPGLTKYWTSNKTNVLENGYVLFNHVTRRKSYIDFYKQYKELENEISEEGFWTKYKREKQANSDLFKRELRSIVKDYFKYKGIMERKALNYPVQGSSADITKLAAIYFYRYIRDNKLLGKVLIPNIIHDEIMAECSIELAPSISKVLQDCMEQAGNKFYTRVSLKAEPVITDFWTH